MHTVNHIPPALELIKQILPIFQRSFKIHLKTVSFKLIDHPHFVPPQLLPNESNHTELIVTPAVSVHVLHILTFQLCVAYWYKKLQHDHHIQKPSGFSKRKIFWTEQRERGELRCWQGRAFVSQPPSWVQSAGFIWVPFGCLNVQLFCTAGSRERLYLLVRYYACQ